MSEQADNKRMGDVLEVIGHPELPYLGNIEDVQAILHGFLSDILEIRESDENVPAKIEGTAREVADVFLGKDEDAAHPVETFNAPGGIDRHLASELNIEELGPDDTIVVALCTLGTGALEIIDQNVAEEQWKEGMKALLDEYTSLFVGLSTKDEG